jgi:hypothetical protein
LQHIAAKLAADDVTMYFFSKLATFKYWKKTFLPREQLCATYSSPFMKDFKKLLGKGLVLSKKRWLGVTH